MANEALAAGCNVVVSETAGVARSIVDMEGVFVAPPSVTGLAHAMRASRDQWRGAHRPARHPGAHA